MCEDLSWFTVFATAKCVRDGRWQQKNKRLKVFSDITSVTV